MTDLKTIKAWAEESDRLKTAFLASINNEIGTPLNVIPGSTEMLTQDGRNQCETAEEYIKNIKESCDELLLTINNIIDLSRLEARQAGFGSKLPVMDKI